MVFLLSAGATIGAVKRLLTVAFLLTIGATSAQTTLPNGPLTLRDFSLRFDASGTFALSGVGWPAMSGTWTVAGSEVTLLLSPTLKDCAGPGRYTFAVTGSTVTFAVVADECEPRRMILDRNA